MGVTELGARAGGIRGVPEILPGEGAVRHPEIQLSDGPEDDCRHGASILDGGNDARLEASYAKLFSCDMCMQTCVDAVQVHGGYGYIKEFRVERMMRDAKVFSIGAGTSEVQRMIICHYLRR